MIISLSSIITALMMETILIVILTRIIPKEKIIKCVGPQFLIILLVMVAIRMLFPIEFGYTISIYFYDEFAIWRDMFDICLIPSVGVPTVGQCFLVVWIIGIAYVGVKKYNSYHDFKRLLLLLPDMPEEKVHILKSGRFAKEYPEVMKIRFVEMEGFVSPFLFGIRNPVVVMPKRNFSTQELLYVGGHEVMHYRCHDSFLKLMLSYLDTIYWWLFAFRRLEKLLFQLIEIKNDMKLTRNMSEQERTGYIECLYKIAEEETKKHPVSAICFSKRDVKALAQRLEMIASGSAPKKVYKGMMGVFTAVLLFLSTALVFEPAHSVQKDNGVPIDSRTCFLVENGDNYDVYMYGEYVYTTMDGETMEPYTGIKRFDSLEEAQEYEE